MAANILQLPNAKPNPITSPRSTLLRWAIPEALGIGIGHFTETLNRWPTISLSCAPQKGMQDYDLTLRLSSDQGPTSLAHIDWVYVANPHYLLAADITPKCNDLDQAELRFVLPDYAYAPIGASSVIVAPSAQDCLCAAIQGAGLTALPRALIQAELAQGHLITLQNMKPDMPAFLHMDGPALTTHPEFCSAIGNRLQTLFS